MLKPHAQVDATGKLRLDAPFRRAAIEVGYYGSSPPDPLPPCDLPPRREIPYEYPTCPTWVAAEDRERARKVTNCLLRERFRNNDAHMRNYAALQKRRKRRR